MDLEYLTCNAGGSQQWKYADLHGRKHLVVNAVTITEGVHTGSKGKVYYSKDFLKKRPASWDHKPAVTYHPENKSACDPTVLNTRSTGVQLNTQYAEKDGIGRWKAEVWIDEDRQNAVDKRVVTKVKNNQPVEVSTGLYIQMREEKGTWNGESYDFVAEDYSPDHLAILPDKVGACSIKKGAGLLQNEAAKLPENLQFVLERTVDNALARAGLEMVGNELSFSQVSRGLGDLLSRRFGERGQYWRGYVIDVFPDAVVFDNGDGQARKLGYSASESAVELSKDNPVPVSRVVSYEAVKNESPNPDGEQDMAFDKKAHVTKLVANGQIKEADRAKYEALDDTVVEGIQVVEKAAPAVQNEQKKEPEVAPAAPKPKTREEWLNEAPDDMKEVWNEMATETNEKKAELVTNILAAKNCPYTKEELEEKKLPELKKIHTLVTNNAPARPTGGGQIPLIGNVNYGPAGGATAPNNGTKVDNQQGKGDQTPPPAGPKPLTLPRLPVQAKK